MHTGGPRLPVHAGCYDLQHAVLQLRGVRLYGSLNSLRMINTPDNLDGP